jgi:acetylornithine deacetylase
VSDLLPAALEILDRLVGFDTVSRHSNLALIDYVRAYLSNHGIAHDVLPSPDGTKANIFASIGPAGRPGIVLSGHTDVVPVDGQTWTHDPFTLTRVGARLYGRGTTDMKGYVACMLALAPGLQRAELHTPVHLAISYDEEVGCFGVHGIVAHMQNLGVQPSAALIGEPSRNGIVNGHKGSTGMLTRVGGLSVHSSRPDRGLNAIVCATEVVTWLRDRAAALAAAPDSVGVFDPPYTTASVGIIQGGTVRNAIPGDCRIEWDIRATRPGVVEAIVGDLAAFVEARLLPGMRERYADAFLRTDMIFNVAPLVPDPGCAAERLAKALTGANSVDTVPYASEAGIFQAAGIPSVICGPGDIAQAHTSDEWIEVGQLAACLAVLQRLAAHVGAR